MQYFRSTKFHAVLVTSATITGIIAIAALILGYMVLGHYLNGQDGFGTGLAGTTIGGGVAR